MLSRYTKYRKSAEQSCPLSADSNVLSYAVTKVCGRSIELFNFIHWLSTLCSTPLLGWSLLQNLTSVSPRLAANRFIHKFIHKLVHYDGNSSLQMADINMAAALTTLLCLFVWECPFYSHSISMVSPLVDISWQE